MADPLPIPMQDNPIQNERLSQSWTHYIDNLNAAVAAAATSREPATDGGDAAAGAIGEYLSAGSGVIGLPGTGGAINLATLTLQPGDWEVEGNVAFASSGAVTTNLVAGVSSVSAVFDVVHTRLSGTLGTGQNYRIGTGGRVRISSAAIVTMFLIAAAGFSGGAVTAQGEIWARRVR